MTRGLNELSIHLHVLERVKVAYHKLFLSTDGDNSSLDRIFEFLMKSGRYCPSFMDPRVTQQTRIGRIDIHDVEGGVENLGAHLDWKIYLPMNYPFLSIEGPHDDITWVQD